MLTAQGFAPPLKAVTRAVDSVQDDVKNAAFPKDYGQVGRRLGHPTCMHLYYCVLLVLLGDKAAYT